MNYNPGHIDLSGLPRAIDFEAQVARNREIIQALPLRPDFQVTAHYDDKVIGFQRVTVGDKWANDYYYIVNGQEPQGPYADEEDAYKNWYFHHS